jgi:hypothetical protein
MFEKRVGCLDQGGFGLNCIYTAPESPVVRRSSGTDPGAEANL